jgi:hypothetical protein
MGSLNIHGRCAAPVNLAFGPSQVRRKAAVSVLTLQLRQREGRDQSYFDLIIDGESLYDALNPGDMVSCLGWPHRETEQAMAARLLLDLPSHLETSRVELYVCGECADIGCGAITARIQQIAGNQVMWSDFGYENDYDPSLSDTKSYASVGPFTFDYEAYRRAIEARWSPTGPN